MTYVPNNSGIYNAARNGYHIRTGRPVKRAVTIIRTKETMLASFWSTSVWPYIVLHKHFFTIGSALTTLNFIVKYMLILHPVADWVTLAEKNPRLASLARLLSAIGINPVSAVQALVDLLRGSVSPGTKAELRAALVSASSPVIAPAKAPAGSDMLATSKAVQEAFEAYVKWQMLSGQPGSPGGFVDFVEQTVAK